MKKLFFLLSGLVVLAFACTKKPANVNCWQCTSNDSVTSNIPALANPHYDGQSGLTCRLNESQKNFYVLQNTKVDTLFFRNDTLRENHWTMKCEVAY